MRPIKFRARITENGKKVMFYQNDQYLISFLRRVSNFVAYEKDGEGRHESYLDKSLSEYLDQFTGLLDKNGKEIYEGDIIGGSLGSVGVMKFEVDGTRAGFTQFHPLGEFEVVGNIYENPELISPEKETNV